MYLVLLPSRSLATTLITIVLLILYNHTHFFLSMVFSESTILLAVVGFVGLIATATVWLRSNNITSKYYAKTDALSEETN